MWIDIHAHLNMLEQPVEMVLQQAQEQGVEQIITIGTNPKDLPIVLQIAGALYPRVFCTLGIHPHEAESFTAEVEGFIRQNIGRSEVVAVGEIGLDYYYNRSDQETQRQAFRRQLRIAADHQLPVQIHTRDAEEDTVKILREFSGQIGGVIHCFTGSHYLAREALQLGLNISVSGIATFKNASELREVIKGIPLDRLHVETDAPFLAPVPKRGKTNVPAFLPYTAQFLADMKGVSIEELARQVRENNHRVFSKCQPAS